MKDIAEIKDKILIHLNNDSNRAELSSMIAASLDINRNAVYTYSSEIELDGYIKSDEIASKDYEDKFLSIMAKGKHFINTSSYTEEFNKKHKIARDQQLWERSKILIPICISIISVSVAIYFGILNNNKDRVIEAQSKEIKKLKETIERR